MALRQLFPVHLLLMPVVVVALLIPVELLGQVELEAEVMVEILLVVQMVLLTRVAEEEELQVGL